MPKERAVPRPFTMHWGGGMIVEEASTRNEYAEPAIQLMEYTDGETAGSGGYSIRFCHFSPDGRFQRSPMMIGEADIQGLRDALRRTPKLRAILRRLVS
jgi:hypothetical protein